MSPSPAVHHVPGGADAGDGDPGEGLGLRLGPDHRSEDPAPGAVPERRLSPVQRHEVPPQLLQEGAGTVSCLGIFHGLLLPYIDLFFYKLYSDRMHQSDN